MLSDNGDGSFQLENFSPQGTFVDGRQIVKTRVTKDTLIQLSPTTTVKVADLLPLPAPETPKINPSSVISKTPAQQQEQKPAPEFSTKELEHVWNQYEQAKKELAHKQHSMGLLVRIPMLFTALTGILSATLPPEFRTFTLVLTVISAIIMVYGFVQQKSFVYQDEMEKLNSWMMDNYVCPNPDCHHFMNLQAYKLIKQDKKCRFCGCKLKHD